MKFVVSLLLSLGIIVTSSSFRAYASRGIVEQCPTISVSSSPLTPEQKPSVVFEARLAGGDTKVKPTYSWTISAGTIKSGQGTSVLTVEMPAPDAITAAVTIGGFAANCPTTASYTIVPGVPRLSSTKVGEYNPNSATAKRFLDDFSNVLKSKEDSQAYIVAYGGSKLSRNEAQFEAQFAAIRARNYLIGVGIWLGRIEIIDGGIRAEPALELWLTPAGATPPKPEPTEEPKDTKKKQRDSGGSNKSKP